MGARLGCAAMYCADSIVGVSSFLTVFGECWSAKSARVGGKESEKDVGVDPVWVVPPFFMHPVYHDSDDQLWGTGGWVPAVQVYHPVDWSRAGPDPISALELRYRTLGRHL